MAITLFYRFVVTFADATTRDVPTAGHEDRLYHIVESPQRRWTISENDESVVMTDEQYAELSRLLATLQPLPDPAIEPTFSGCDGTWYTVVVQRGGEQQSYRWWVYPPNEWNMLGGIAFYVQQLADIPRERVVQQQRQITRQFFDRLAARDLPQMLAYYHPDILYSNQLFEARGVEVGAMWQMWWSRLPDMRVVCKDSGIRNGGTYWEAHYTFPPTGRHVQHALSADFTFADDKIIRHVDRFNFHEWANKAYGFVGGVIGGWRLFEGRVTASARTQLAAFLHEQQEV